MNRESQNFHFWKRLSSVQVSLFGDPPYGFRIGKTIWDLGAFRPDPRYFIEKNEEYKSQIIMETSNLYSGRKVTIPREVHISEHRFINMR